MRISGFTIARNALKFNYPILASIQSILPLCDEFIVNVGDSEDETLKLIESLKDPKIRVIRSRWDMDQGKEVLSRETNRALRECRGDWAFYLQSDEVLHERDLPRLKRLMNKYAADKNVDALRFQWFHFYGSYHRYRIDGGWYQKQDRIIRNNGAIESFGDAFAFKRKDGRELARRNTGCFIYHYGWVQSREEMAERIVNAQRIGYAAPEDRHVRDDYSYGDLTRFPVYFGTHPAVMVPRIKAHELSRQDRRDIDRRYWWNPARIFHVRYKTGRRIKERIG